jgi:hypothetical protein
LEITRKPLPDGTVCLTVTVPSDKADGVATALEGILRLAGEDCESIVPAAEVLPDMTPGKVLRGARGLREMTQAQLAETLRIPKSNVSEMERDARPIGKEMAKRLGKALEMPYKAFL